MHPGLLAQACLLGPGQSGCPDVVVEVGSPDRSIVTTATPAGVGEYPLAREIELCEDPGGHVDRADAAWGLGGPRLVTLTRHITPRSPDINIALSQIDVTRPQGGGFAPSSPAGNQELDQGLPWFRDSVVQDGELFVGEEHHLV